MSDNDVDPISDKVIIALLATLFVLATGMAFVTGAQSRINVTCMNELKEARNG